MQEILIKDFYGRITGRIEVDSDGNKIVKDFYGRVLGRYDAKLDVTKDFYGRVVARGDAASSLIGTSPY